MTTISPTATHTSLQRLIGLQTDGGSMSVVKATDIDATQAKRAAAFVAASSSSAARNPMGVPMPRSPERAPTTAAEVPALLRGMQGVDMAECAADEVREMMGRTSRLVDGAFNAAAKGGAEPAAVREQLSAFHADVTATPGGLDGIVGSLSELRDSGLLDSGDTPSLKAKLDELLAVDKETLIEQTRSDAMLALMVLLMGLLMLMKEVDRNLATAALIKAESFVAEAGERMVESAEKHALGAIIALSISAAVAMAGVTASGFGAYKNVQSFKSNSRIGIDKTARAENVKSGQAEGLASAGKGTAPNQAQTTVAGSNRLNVDSRLADVKHSMNASENAIWLQGGQSLGQLGNGAGSVAQSQADVEASRQTRLQQNLQKAADTAKAESDQGNRRADEQRSMQSQMESRLSNILDESHGTIDAIGRNV